MIGTKILTRRKDCFFLYTLLYSYCFIYFILLYCTCCCCTCPRTYIIRIILICPTLDRYILFCFYFTSITYIFTICTSITKRIRYFCCFCSFYFSKCPFIIFVYIIVVCYTKKNLIILIVNVEE